MRLLTVAMILTIALLTSSCRKCAQCTITATQTVTGQQPTTATTTTELCGDDLKEADGNVTTSTSTVQGYTATIVTRTNCQ